MPTVPNISFCAVGQIGFWKSALDEVKESYPTLRADAPRRPPTYLPPPLPVEEKMHEIYRFQGFVDQSIVFIRDNAITAEEVMALRVIEWLATAQRNETGRIQRKIWALDPERFQREIRDGHVTVGNSRVASNAVQVVAINAGGNAAGNAAGDAAGDATGNAGEN
ncbi:hypothetical protein H9Q72_000371 [Fusarium xylarioides]|uniref:Uncharacterized protein n=1 Tax=Fusarium xylarioides TaxID=221167 RepID=A0A9P7L6U1_9HYPO|nr:hypothetical protein H9Q70_001588 [Fusarium xylarioides]KAG5774082.1 hypothetical protein H9Q72_000371 [Fusarium xylarioides]KAG5774777.1 hypothetical protein H9Q73_011546 [Fusarium xylarioides]